MSPAGPVWLLALTLFLGSGMLGAAPAAGGSPAGGGVSAREQELETLRAQIRDVQASIESAKGERRDLSATLRETERSIGDLTRHLRVLAGQIERHGAELSALGDRRTAQQRELDKHRQALAAQMRAAYAMGRQERLKILLNQEDPAMVSRVLVYYDYFNRARAEQVKAVQRSVDQLAATEDAITAERDKVLQLQASDQEQRQVLEQARAARSEVLAALNQEINSQGEELAGLKKDEESLQRLIERLQRALIEIPAETADRPSFVSRKGKLSWPAAGQLVAGFGAPRRVGGMRWDGVLIAAPEGEEVHAVARGRVAFADWLRGYGLLLIIDHGDGYMTLYGHNESLFKETGEWVEAGEPVALVGSTGGRSRAGVYFGIRYRGQPVDPAAWCKPVRNHKIG
jgi:septal ring factor EnvC (AmiA/AmiB activator)